MKGEMESSYFYKDLSVSGIDLISKLKMAFMINAEVSKGKFFASPSYVYAKIGTDVVVKTTGNGESISMSPEVALNIAGLIVGLHEVVSEKFIVDPYIGVRYNGFDIAMELDGLIKVSSFEEKANFTDPLIGLRFMYFPHPRVPVMFRADAGGFGIGSDYSWSAFIDAGYTLSPQIDLMAGFSAYGFEYTGEIEKGSVASLSMLMYGVNIGMKIMFPRRARDPEVFKKFK
jgi:hypothetical protein